MNEELSRVYYEMALTKAQDLKDKADAFFSEQGSSTHKSTFARMATTVTTASLYDLEAEEQTLTNEKYYIQDLLRYKHG